MMLPQSLVLLLAITLRVNAGVITAGKAANVLEIQPTCGCTTTLTEYKVLQARQETCPPPVTVTITQAPPVATIVAGDPSSIASFFSYASGIDSIENQNSIEDRPTGDPPETTPIFYTNTASGPAIIGTDDPKDGTIVYHYSTTGYAPVATTTVSFAPADPVYNGQEFNSSTNGSTSLVTTQYSTETVTTYRSTVYVSASPRVTTLPSNLSITSRNQQKRQTCSMIFAEINGHWASWCNDYFGSTTVKYSTYETTTLVTSVDGAPPVPESVYSQTSSQSSVTIQTSPPEEPTSTTPADTNTSTSTALSSVESTSSLSSQAPAMVTSIVITTSVVVTYPIATITQTISDTAASSTSNVSAATASCGQVGPFTITFDDLPSYSTNNPNGTASPPIFDPYDHFYWSSGFGYGPPPSFPYAPHDGDRLAVYNTEDAVEKPVNGTEGRNLPGSFGAGPRAWDNIYSFDAVSAYVGCNNTVSTDQCVLTATAYRWIASQAPNASKTDGHEVYVTALSWTIPTECATPPCPLEQIAFDTTDFSGLSTINLEARIGNVLAEFYLDSFEGAWTNSSCEAGLERQSSRK